MRFRNPPLLYGKRDKILTENNFVTVNPDLLGFWISSPYPNLQDQIKQKTSSRGKYVSVNIGPVLVKSSEEVSSLSPFICHSCALCPHACIFSKSNFLSDTFLLVPPCRCKQCTMPWEGMTGWSISYKGYLPIIPHYVFLKFTLAQLLLVFNL